MLHTLRPNFFYAWSSMVLVLFLVGLFGSVILQSGQLVSMFKERVMVVMEIRNGFSSEEISSLQEEIRKRRYVKSGSVEYTSKEKALKLMMEDFGSEVNLEDYNLGNPLYDIVSFHVQADDMNEASLQGIEAEWEEDKRVSDVNYEKGIADNINGYWGRLGWIGFVASLLLLLIAVFLIIYAVKQALYSDRFIIRNMHLVGATPHFISRPYIMRSILGGLFSSVLASVGLLLLRVWLVSIIPEITELFPIGHWFMIASFLIVVAVLIAAFSTRTTLRNYLKSEVAGMY
ncbi:MAG: cell division protein FtsX [Saprospiraceae bacterium]